MNGYRQSCFLFLIFTTFILASSARVNAAQLEYPTTGLVHSTTENSSISYECSLNRETLNCKFVQTFVHFQLTESDAAKKRVDRLKGFDKAVADSKECSELGSTLTKIRNKSVPGFESLPKPEFTHMMTGLNKWNTFCEHRTRENYAAAVDNDLDGEIHTCRVGSNPFEQSFHKKTDSKGNPVWIVDSQASGNCGVVRLDRFEIAPDTLKDKFHFWRYISKKAVTNPSGDGALLQCKDLDEGTYIYDWKSRQHFMGCNIVEFSVF